jgi:Ca2+-binding RTX toxin-like protein
MAKNLEDFGFYEINGGPGNNVLYDIAYGAEIYGMGGNDVIVADKNDKYWNGLFYEYFDDIFHGGSGSDTVTYVLSEKAVTANLDTNVVHRYAGNAVQSTDYLDSIENLTGSKLGDTIYGSSGVNDLRGGGGNDLIFGLAGNDRVWGDSGNDTIGGGDGNDAVDGGTGNDDIEGALGNDTLTGGDGEDTLHGAGQNDVLKGGGHNDQLFGQSGDDRLEGGSGADLLDGGEGTDTAVYTGAGAVNIDLAAGTATSAWGSDTLVSIERIETGSGNDQILAGDGGLWLSSGAGKDLIFGSDEIDIVYSGSGRDIVYGYGGDDEIYASTGSDVLNGLDGDDKLYGESDQDEINGGNGDDALYGGAGSDLIRAGDGFDTINGGTGPDLIVWGNGDGGVDTIVGFNLNEDKLWFGEGFFDHDAIGPLHLEDVLTVIDSGPDAILGANTAESGWTYLAVFTNVDANALSTKIANGSILAPLGTDLGDLLG